MDIKVRSIGVAKNHQTKHFGGWKNVETEIVLEDAYREALDGLDGYSHCIVVYWMHEVKTCDLKHVPQGKVGEVPEVGIFACRCAQRPNPIGLTTVKILNIKGNVVNVQGLDVIDGTPILDLKPYTPQYDAVADAKVPPWVDKLAY